MKRRTKIIIGLMTVCAASLTFAAACSSWDTAFDEMDELNCTASVRYDINGGQFSNTNNVNIVDGFKLEDAQKGVKLYEPGSAKRGEGRATSIPSRSGYFLAGWYRVRELRVDKDGNPLDEDGNLCSVSKKPQGYMYDEKWNFDVDKFVVQEAETSSVQSMTLYAGWVPNLKFNFLVQNGESGEWEKASEYSFSPLIYPDQQLPLPYWDDNEELEKRSSSMIYGRFPVIQDKTFNKIYDLLDKEITTPYITHGATIDFAHGVADFTSENYHLELLDGTWYKIYTLKQFIENARTNGCYELYTDLNFDKQNGWSYSLATGAFTGAIVSSDDTVRHITGIEVNQSNHSQLFGGIFGRISEGAKFENVSFDNVKYNLDAATRLNGGEFGLFAGSIDAKAQFKNVHVSGVLSIGNVYSPYTGYKVGLLCSNIAALSLVGKLDYNITHTVTGVTEDGKTIYPHKVTVNQDGTVTLSTNPDNTKP